MAADPDSKKLTRLLERMFEGRLVPFAGAGISLGAQHESRCDFEPSTAAMKRALARALHSMIEASSPAVLDALPEEMADLAKPEAHCKYNLDRLAEAAHWLFGAAGVCTILAIPAFAELQPRPAHRYLAYLAREGLITEIITTNYDCCIERAFRDSFGPPAGGGVTQSQSDAAFKVIYDLDSYRRGGGLHQTGHGRPTLRLYKINGCAWAYTYGRQAAGQIILSERQLQDFGARRWARDLLADRVRTSALLFCSFGSEEPQVRHTALAIIDEFRDSANGHDPGALANAPAIVPHKRVSFVQAQLALAYHRAHYGSANDVNYNDAEALAAALGEFVLTISDIDETAGPREPIEADLFFERLYQAAMSRLIRRLLYRDGGFYAWLDTLTCRPGVWCESIRANLYNTGTEFGLKKTLFSLVKPPQDSSSATGAQAGTGPQCCEKPQDSPAPPIASVAGVAPRGPARP
ncbi:MAG: hypothetical protein GKR94_26165 [Gammaproteobacteria bacterium]|nr:hypothetical protein [Gammaproteobacteria bacterium]